MGTLERITPNELKLDDSFSKETLILHLERYDFAKQYLLPGILLDIACGVGYGTDIISKSVHATDKVYGVDISPDAIAYAKQHYVNANTSFVQSDIKSFLTDRKDINTIVSLETIEHIPGPKAIVQLFYDSLVKGGRLIISAPVTPSVDANPFHVNDFSPSSFRKMFTSIGFKEIGAFPQLQPYTLKTILSKKDENRTTEIRKGLIGWYITHPGKLFLRLRSLLVDGLNNKYLTLVLEK